MSLKKDAMSVCGGIYRLNATQAIGYLFNPTIDGKKVATGMFCDREDEINYDQWTYFIDFRNNYKMTKIKENKK